MYMLIFLLLLISVWSYVNNLYNKSFYKIKKGNIFVYLLLGFFCFWVILIVNTMLDLDSINNVIVKFSIVSIVEENFKAFFVLLGVLYTTKVSKDYIKSTRDLDFIILNVILVFSLLETILYFLSLFSELNFVMRIFISMPLHIMCTIIYCHAVYEKKYVKTMLALIMHTVFNTILTVSVSAFIQIGIFIFIYYKIIKYIYDLYLNIKKNKGYLYDKIDEFNDFKKANQRYW